MKPNLEKMINVLSSKLVESQLEASQWQAIADDLQEEAREAESLREEVEYLRKENEELINGSEDSEELGA